MGTVRRFMETHYLHFNARETVAAAKAWEEHLEAGGKMLVSLAGAMSTGELGIILARINHFLDLVVYFIDGRNRPDPVKVRMVFIPILGEHLHLE